MPFSGIVVGAGACGNRMLDTQVSYSRLEVDESARYVSLFLGVDLAMEAPDGLRNAMETSEPWLARWVDYIYLASGMEGYTRSPAGGVGGLWNISKSIAEKNIESLMKSSKVLNEEALTTASMGPVTISMTMHSAGGGTGVGAGPVISSRLRKLMSNYAGGNMLTTAAITFPFSFEEEWRKTNALFSLYLYSQLLEGEELEKIRPVDVLFLADNEWVMRTYLGGVTSEESKRIVNESITASFRDIFLPSIFPEVSTKDREIPDLRRFFLVSDPPVLVAIGHLDFSIDLLRYMTLRSAIEMTLRYGMLIGVDLDSGPPKSAYIIVELPYDLASARSRGHSVGRAGSHEELLRMLGDPEKDISWLSDRLGKPQMKPVVDFTASKSRKDSFSVTIFLVEPKLIGIHELVAATEKLLSNEEKFHMAYRSSVSEWDPEKVKKALEELRSLSKDIFEEVKNIISRKDILPTTINKNKRFNISSLNIREDDLIRTLRKYIHLGCSFNMRVRVRSSDGWTKDLGNIRVPRGGKFVNLVASVIRELSYKGYRIAGGTTNGIPQPSTIPSEELVRLVKTVTLALGTHVKDLNPNEMLDMRMFSSLEGADISITIGGGDLS